MMAYDRAAAREGRLDSLRPQQILNSRTAAFVHASTAVTEVSVTMAAKYLLDGSLHYCSHSFVKIFVHNLISYLDGDNYTVAMVPAANSSTGFKSSTPKFIDYALRGDGVLDDTDYYVFWSKYRRKTAPYNPDKPGNDFPLDPRHPLALTHCIGKLNHEVVPQLVGPRMPNRSTLDVADAATITLYHKMALALHSPWRSSSPPWSPDRTPADAHAQTTWTDDAQRLLSNHQDYYDQQRLAHASAKARRAAHTVHTADSANGLNLDDFEDGGAAILDAIAMEAIGGKPAEKSMSKTLAAHLALVEASVVSRTCTMTAPTIPAEVLTAVASAEPPSSDAWKPVPESMVARRPADAAHDRATRDAGPRALLVSKALTSAAEASAANIRAAEAVVVPVTHPSLSTISALFHLNAEQNAAFGLSCAPLLQHFLNLAVGDDDDATAQARALLAELSATSAPPLICMSGEGGTGKSEVIKAVTHFASAWGLRPHVALAAFSGSAAILIGGCTIHSFAGISSHNRSAKANVSSAQKADDPVTAIVLLIIDEISLVSADFLGTLSTTLQRKRDCRLPFGGIAVLFCGDFYQLPPVQGLALYDTSEAARIAGPTVQKGFDAWHSLTDVVMLKTNYRAAGDPAFMALLRRVRTHTATASDVAALGRQRVTADHLPPLDSATAWYDNSNVNATNCAAVHYAAAAANAVVYRLPADVRTKKGSPPLPFDGPAHAGWVVGSRKSNRGNLPYSFLDFYIGCPVTLYVNNLLTRQRVARGSRGIVVGTHPPLAAAAADDVMVALPTGSEHPARQLRELPTHLFVLVPGSTTSFAGLPTSVFPVAVQSQTMNVHGHQERMRVSQFPVKLNFAWTCHKLQGKTEPHVTLGCTNRILNYNYTALSRIRRLATLYILKGVKLSLDVLNSPSVQYDMLVTEMARLDTLSTATLLRFAATRGSAPAPVAEAVSNED